MDIGNAPLLPHTAVRIAARAPLRVVAFGSSTTEGVGASTPEATYPARLEVELRTALPDMEVTVINRGNGGEEAEDLARRVPDVIADGPDLVIFQTGTNDALRDVPMERFLALTREGLDAFRAAGIDVLLMEPQYCRAMEDTPGSFAYCEAVRALGVEYGLPVVRRYDLMREWLRSGLLTPAQMVTDDDLHMADAGYAELAHAVARQLLSSATSTS
jgi:acyl-CoA thioesterase-1